MAKNIIIAIDGESGSGKSTLATGIAQILGFKHIDTGAMYRAITWKVIRNNLPIESKEAIQNLLKEIEIHFEDKQGEQKIFINEDDVTKVIRSQEVTSQVSLLAKIPIVRTKMQELQRKEGGKTNSALEGRDIGTVVFPDADIKFFLKANVHTRAKRRYKEIKELNVSLEDVEKNIITRDKIDTTRETSPLKKAADAIEIDTSNYSIEATLEVALKYIREKLDIG